MASLVKNFLRLERNRCWLIVDGHFNLILAAFSSFIDKNVENKSLAGRNFQVDAAASPGFLL